MLYSTQNVSQLVIFVKLDCKSVEPDTYMQKLTHFTVSKIDTEFLCGRRGGIALQLSGRGSAIAYEVGIKKVARQQAHTVGRFETTYFGLSMYQSVYKFNPLIFFLSCFRND